MPEPTRQACFWRRCQSSVAFMTVRALKSSRPARAQARGSVVYLRSNPSFTGRVTVPVLWDKARNIIVSNESSEIIRMMNSAFDGAGAVLSDFYPVELREQIDALNARIYATVNNGVYKAGFATTQDAYEEAVRPLFATFDWLEECHEKPISLR